MARLLSVNVGLPRDIEWKGRTVHTGIWKDPVPGRCRVGRLNLDGDGQGDLAGHGGEQRAVFVYQIESYRHWEEQLRRTDLVFGQFGENFTIEGLPDDVVCIGDRYQIGSALFEVTQPRVTCYRVGIRMNEPRMPALLTSSGRPGFYFRVLREGEVGAGDDIVKLGEAQERMTVAEINALLYSPDHAPDRLQRALRIERAFARVALVVRGVAAEPGDRRGEWERGARAGGSRASGRARISAARGDGDRSRVRGRPLADAAERGRTAAAGGSARPVRGHASSADRRRAATVSQLLALGRPLDRALSNQREARAERGRRNVPARPRAGGRCARRQRAARKLHSADRRAPGGAAQRRDRRDARAGDAACAGGGPLDPAGLVAPRGSRSAASSLRRRGTPPHARAHAWPQLCLLQQAGLARQDGRGLRRCRATSRGRSSTRSASPKRRMSTCAGPLVS